MPTTPNSAGYDSRLNVVKQLIESLGLHASSITTVAYDEACPHPYNNFLFKVDLTQPASSSAFPGTQPGTEAAPSKGLPSFIIKLCNTEIELNQKNRVQNSVTIQHLVRQSMKKSGLPVLVPVIYAWGGSAAKDANTPPWIISDYCPGVDLDTVFSSLQDIKKEEILGDIAAALAAIQLAELPPSASKFGGLTFDDSGYIISGEATLGKGEPVTTLFELKQRSILAALDRAEKSPVIKGWKCHGIDKRIQNLLADGGLQRLLSRVDMDQKTVIHADFTMNNMLFDKKTEKLSAILDFDWSYISNPAEEFLSGLYDLGGHIGDEKDMLQGAILSGCFDAPPSSISEDNKSYEKWQIAKMWDLAMRKKGCIRPCEIKGLEQILDVQKLQRLLCPFRLSNKKQLKQMTEETKLELMAKATAALVEWLEQHGY